MVLPAGPLALGTELSVACPERAAPGLTRPHPAVAAKPAASCCASNSTSRALVANARVDTPSGHERLDQAALAAVRTWRCNPPRRDGKVFAPSPANPFISYCKEAEPWNPLLPKAWALPIS
jgi:protein TonB